MKLTFSCTQHNLPSNLLNFHCTEMFYVMLCDVYVCNFTTILAKKEYNAVHTC